LLAERVIEAIPYDWDQGGTLGSYVYGRFRSSVEQINNSTGTVTYLHHDQAGSTRLMTGSTGTVTGKCTYSAYGTPTCEGTTTTPLGFDGQYTNSDTGLIYMRAREYDPTTAQFLTVDPEVGTTRAPYNYAEDNPLNEADPTGLGNWLDLGLPSPGEVAESLNPIKYYEEEIESYENGCGYFASVAHGLEGAVVGALDASGAGEGELGAEAADQGVAGVIKGYTQHGLEQAIERDAGRGVLDRTYGVGPPQSSKSTTAPEKCSTYTTTSKAQPGSSQAAQAKRKASAATAHTALPPAKAALQARPSTTSCLAAANQRLLRAMTVKW
jgi:RHS repeat-associated protein